MITKMRQQNPTIIVVALADCDAGNYLEASGICKFALLNHFCFGQGGLHSQSASTCFECVSIWKEA